MKKNTTNCILYSHTCKSAQFQLVFPSNRRPNEAQKPIFTTEGTTSPIPLLPARELGSRGAAQGGRQVAATRTGRPAEAGLQQLQHAAGPVNLLGIAICSQITCLVPKKILVSVSW